MPGKKNAATELAEKMVRALKAQRDLDQDSYPLTLKRLAELADLQADQAQVDRASSKKPFKDHVVLARKKAPDALVALSGDVDRLAASPALLESVLETVCTPQSPTASVSILTRQVDGKLKKPFENAINRQVREGTLPPTVGHVLIKNKSQLYLRRMPPPRKPEVELADKLLQVLEAQRRLGPDSYPVTLNRLVEQAAAGADTKLVQKATATAPFAERALLAQKVDLDPPVALNEDLEQLAASPLLLMSALKAHCTPAKPTATVEDLKKKVVPSLRQPFAEAVKRQIGTHSLPAGVEWLSEKKALHPLWLPLPKPPQVDLAERLVGVLEGRRTLGDDAYPVPLRRLVELTEPQVKPALLKKALATDVFTNRAVPLVPKYPDSPVAVKDDLVRVAGSGRLLEGVVRAARTEGNQVFAVTDLVKKVAAGIQPAFAAAVAQQVENGSLPSSLGWVLLKKKKMLFLMEDVHGGRRPAGLIPPAPKPPREDFGSREAAPPQAPADFPAAFDEAFHRLDRQKGSHNFVSLVDLRQALPLDRARFDAELRQLRVAGRYTLSAAEGRHGISPQEREAGINEAGALLLFVSRK